MYKIEPVTVYVRREEVAAFAASLGLEDVADECGVPWTFPAIWLAHPVVREALFSVLRKDEVPVHESQEFNYSAAGLTIDAALVMAAHVCREEFPDKVRIIIDMRFMKDEAAIARLTCRLLAIPSIAGAHVNATGRP